MVYDPANPIQDRKGYASITGFDRGGPGTAPNFEPGYAYGPGFGVTPPGGGGGIPRAPGMGGPKQPAPRQPSIPGAPSLTPKATDPGQRASEGAPSVNVNRLRPTGEAGATMAGKQRQTPASPEMLAPTLAPAPAGGAAGGGMKPVPAPKQESTSPTVATRPVALDRQGNAIPGVSGRLQDLLNAENPYMRQARNRAMQQAARRGLQNSSIAASAGEEAAIQAALPIAQADAGIAAQERGLRSAEFRQAEQIKSNEGIAKAQRELQDMLQQRDHRVKQLMQTRQFTFEGAQRQADRESREGIAAAERALRSSLQAARLAAEQSMQAARFQHSELMFAKETQVKMLMQERGFSHDQAMAHANRTFNAAENQLNRQLELGLAGMKYYDSELSREQGARTATQNNVVNAMTNYSRMIGIINANEDLPADERAEQRLEAMRIRDTTLNLINQMARKGTKMIWTPAPSPPGAPEPEPETATTTPAPKPAAPTTPPPAATAPPPPAAPPPPPPSKPTPEQIAAARRARDYMDQQLGRGQYSQ